MGGDHASTRRACKALEWGHFRWRFRDTCSKSAMEECQPEDLLGLVPHFYLDEVMSGWKRERAVAASGRGAAARTAGAPRYRAVERSIGPMGADGGHLHRAAQRATGSICPSTANHRLRGRRANLRLQRTACRPLLLYLARSARGTQPLKHRAVRRHGDITGSNQQRHRPGGCLSLPSYKSSSRNATVASFHAALN